MLCHDRHAALSRSSRRSIAVSAVVPRRTKEILELKMICKRDLSLCLQCMTQFHLSCKFPKVSGDALVVEGAIVYISILDLLPHPPHPSCHDSCSKLEPQLGPIPLHQELPMLLLMQLSLKLAALRDVASSQLASDRILHVTTASYLIQDYPGVQSILLPNIIWAIIFSQ